MRRRAAATGSPRSPGVPRDAARPVPTRTTTRSSRTAAAVPTRPSARAAAIRTPSSGLWSAARIASSLAGAPRAAERLEARDRGRDAARVEGAAQRPRRLVARKLLAEGRDGAGRAGVVRRLAPPRARAASPGPPRRAPSPRAGGPRRSRPVERRAAPGAWPGASDTRARASAARRGARPARARCAGSGRCAGGCRAARLGGAPGRARRAGDRVRARSTAAAVAAFQAERALRDRGRAHAERADLVHARDRPSSSEARRRRVSASRTANASVGAVCTKHCSSNLGAPSSISVSPRKRFPIAVAAALAAQDETPPPSPGSRRACPSSYLPRCSSSRRTRRPPARPSDERPSKMSLARTSSSSGGGGGLGARPEAGPAASDPASRDHEDGAHRARRRDASVAKDGCPLHVPSPSRVRRPAERQPARLAFGDRQLPRLAAGERELSGPGAREAGLDPWRSPDGLRCGARSRGLRARGAASRRRRCPPGRGRAWLPRAG